MPRCRFALAWSCCAALASAAPPVARAQGDLEGRILADGSRAPIAGAEVRVRGVERAARTDSAGRFLLADLPSGARLVVIRALGYRPDSVRVAIAEGQVVVRDFVLLRTTQALAEVKVTGEATHPKMSSFEDHRRMGIGHFLDRKELARVEHKSMSTIMSGFPGMAVWHGTTNAAWAYTTRIPAGAGGQCAFCPNVSGIAPEDAFKGADAHKCYLDVYLDGSLVYMHDAPAPMGLYNLNSIPADQIEGIEVYTSTAQMPAMYNRTGSRCGALVIWTRVSK